MKFSIPVCLVAVAAALCAHERALAQGPCGHPHGDHVVIGVKWDDPIRGLAVRAGPSAQQTRLGIIPAAGTGVGVGDCLPSGWCQVRYACVSGWSLLARHLAPRFRRLRRVIGVSASDPEGLNVRAGPAHTYAVKSRIPHDGTDVIAHQCEPSPADRTQWCLVTHQNESGWVAARFLAPVTASSPPTTPVPPPVSGTPAPTPSPGPSSRACQLFPDLC